MLYFVFVLSFLFASQLIHAQVSSPAPKGLKSRHAALKLAELIKETYEITQAVGASDQVKLLIRESLDQQSRSGYRPVDAWGTMSRQKPQEIVSLLSKLWHEVKSTSTTPKQIRRVGKRTIGIMNHEHLQIILESLLTPSIKNSARFRKIKTLLEVPSDGPLRNSIGLLETSYSLALENMISFPKRLRRWRKRDQKQTNETIKLFKESLAYLKKQYQRGEALSGEQFALIHFSLATCYLALDELKSAKKHFKTFFQTPSSGEAILLLQSLLNDLSNSTQEKAQELEQTSQSSQKYRRLLNSLTEWSALLNDERQRLRILKGKARDYLNDTVSLKSWWNQEIEQTRQLLLENESNLSLQQLLSSLMQSAQSSQLIALGAHPIKWIKIPAGQLLG